MSSPSTFTPTSPVSSSERDWAANLGMLDWDTTSIVFTKRSLLDFLKYTGTTVDTNFANIQKLPRYVKFGKIGDTVAETPAAGNLQSESAGPSQSAASADFKPTRRVREPPGGRTSNIFGDEDVLDALSLAPPKVENNVPVASPELTAEVPTAVEKEKESDVTSGTDIKPSRRVREAPGGNSSIQSFWGSDEPEEFKPTRRVRQPPGGGSFGIF
ncbi:hypothetical protein C8R44DRAFT_801717 [Mycena epipterygia]|nr:hypothetical protein C8R44DRAFT_801717 [Mycena epipterygia]